MNFVVISTILLLKFSELVHRMYPVTAQENIACHQFRCIPKGSILDESVRLQLIINVDLKDFLYNKFIKEKQSDVHMEMYASKFPCTAITKACTYVPKHEDWTEYIDKVIYIVLDSEYFTITSITVDLTQPIHMYTFFVDCSSATAHLF